MLVSFIIIKFNLISQYYYSCLFYNFQERKLSGTQFDERELENGVIKSRNINRDDACVKIEKYLNV